MFKKFKKFKKLYLFIGFTLIMSCTVVCLLGCSTEIAPENQNQDSITYDSQDSFSEKTYDSETEQATDSETEQATDSETEQATDSETEQATDSETEQATDSNSDQPLETDNDTVTEEPNQPDNCYVGRYNIKEPEDIEGLSDYNCIIGDLFIGIEKIGVQDPILNTSLYNLNGLEKLRYITGNLYIGFTENLSDLSALSNIKTVGRELYVWRNDALTTLFGFQSVESVRDLLIWVNDGLENLSGLSSLKEVTGMVSIAGNWGMTDLSGMPNLKKIEQDAAFYDNILLTSMEGMENLTRVGGDLIIRRNAELKNLNGLENLAFVGGQINIGYIRDDVLNTGNPVLENLDGLSGLKRVGGTINIFQNANLPDCELCRLADNITNGHRLMTGYGENLSDECTETCPNNTNVCYKGDVLITKDSDFDALAGYECIIGNLEIGGGSFQYLTGLEDLTSVSGGVYIHDNFNLRDIKGISNLFLVGSYIDIYNNQTLRFNGEMRKLIGSIRELLIVDNLSVDSFKGFENITHIQQNLVIAGNPNITSLTGLQNISWIGIGLYIGMEAVDKTSAPLGNEKLVDISALKTLKYVGWFVNVLHNESLPNLQGLEGLNNPFLNIDIGNNNSLTNLSGLSGFQTINSLQIRGNDALVNLKGLENLQIIRGRLGIGGYDVLSIPSDNVSLTSLKGIENLTHVGSCINIFNNSTLPQCEVDNWISHLTKRGECGSTLPNGSEDPSLCEL